MCVPSWLQTPIPQQQKKEPEMRKKKGQNRGQEKITLYFGVSFYIKGWKMQNRLGQEEIKHKFKEKRLVLFMIFGIHLTENTSLVMCLEFKCLTTQQLCVLGSLNQKLWELIQEKQRKTNYIISYPTVVAEVVSKCSHSQIW